MTVDSHTPVRARALEVVSRPDESPEKMLRRFTKKVRNDGVLQELYLRRAYEKPSIRRRRKRLRAQFNKRIADRAAQEN